MTFFDWADKHPVALVLCVLFLALSVPSFTYSRGVKK
jgi:hypothetical protein